MERSYVKCWVCKQIGSQDIFKSTTFVKGFAGLKKSKENTHPAGSRHDKKK